MLRACALVLAAGLSLGLAACGRGADSGATANPNAPGRPGTGNAPVVVQPTAPDTPAGGSSGEKGSMPTAGASGGDAVPGASGGGGAASQPSANVQGGMGTGAASAPAEGSTNRTTKGSVGNR